MSDCSIDENVTMPRLIDVAAVCSLTSLSVSRIYMLIQEGELRRVKIGRKTLFVEAEIKAWIEAKIAASPKSRPAGYVDIEGFKAAIDKGVAEMRAQEAA